MTDRTPLIAGNWKMYKTVSEAAATAGELARLCADVRDVEMMIAPPFTALSAVSAELANSRIALGGQNLHWEDQGAFTGEISGPMLVSAGCSHVTIGHSERRQYFGETDATVNRRIRAALSHGLVPVFCVGETEEQRESGQTLTVLDKQVNDGLRDFVSGDLDTLVIAYEPVWAIGTGKTATSAQAQEAHNFLRQLVARGFGQELADGIRILYGGSVKPANVVELMAMADVDGALVGGASLEAETFSKIIHYRNGR